MCSEHTQVAAKNATAATGDFNLGVEERTEITTSTNCLCLKDQYAHTHTKQTLRP